MHKNTIADAVHNLLRLHEPKAVARQHALGGRPVPGLFLICADADRALQIASECVREREREVSNELVLVRDPDTLATELRQTIRRANEEEKSAPALVRVLMFPYRMVSMAGISGLLRVALSDRCIVVVMADEHGPPGSLSTLLEVTRVARTHDSAAGGGGGGGSAVGAAADWTALGGLHAVKQRLRVALEWPRTHGDTMARLGVRASRGVLLHGPPGCGKTSLVRGVAAVGGAHFVALAPADVYSCYVGEAERRVRAVFAEARARAPAILFLDEIDATAGARSTESGGGGGTDVSRRVLATLLTEMDGVSACAGVTVVAATNRLDAVDDALKRPGRFDDVVHVPLPDDDDRRQILQYWMSGTGKAKGRVAGDFDLEWLVQRTQGCSAAHITGICKEAALAAAREVWSGISSCKKPCVEKRHLEWALESAR